MKEVGLVGVSLVTSLPLMVMAMMYLVMGRPPLSEGGAQVTIKAKELTPNTVTFRGSDGAMIMRG